jgi:hypothetical protein
MGLTVEEFIQKRGGKRTGAGRHKGKHSLKPRVKKLLEIVLKATPPKPYGNVKYGAPAEGKYPLDTEAHIRAAWSYANMPKNASGVSNMAATKSRIIAAWKKKIDPAGPPSASQKVYELLEKTMGTGPFCPGDKVQDKNGKQFEVHPLQDHTNNDTHTRLKDETGRNYFIPNKNLSPVTDGMGEGHLAEYQQTADGATAKFIQKGGPGSGPRGGAHPVIHTINQLARRGRNEAQIHEAITRIHGLDQQQADSWKDRISDAVSSGGRFMTKTQKVFLEGVGFVEKGGPGSGRHGSGLSRNFSRQM